MNKMIKVSICLDEYAIERSLVDPVQTENYIKESLLDKIFRFSLDHFDDHFLLIAKRDMIGENSAVICGTSAYIIRSDKIKNVLPILKDHFIEIDGKQVSIAEYLDLV